jgi:hypothetical protein
MARRCTVCAHAEAHQINRLLLSGASIRDVAGRFSLSRTAVGNHSTTHLRQRVAEGARALACGTPDASPEAAHSVELARDVRQREETRIAENASLREHLARDLARLDRIYDVAVAAGRLGDATKAINAAWTIKNRAGLLTDLDARPTAAPETDPSVAGVRVLHDAIASFMADAARITGRVPFPLDVEEVEESDEGEELAAGEVQP